MRDPSVTIEPGPGYMGMASTGGFSDLARVWCALAGVAAEEVMGESDAYDEILYSADGDRENAEHALRRMMPGADDDDVDVEREMLLQLSYVIQLVRRRWRYVERLAEELLKRRTMHEDALLPYMEWRGLRYPRRFLIESERLNRGRYIYAEAAS